MSIYMLSIKKILLLFQNYAISSIVVFPKMKLFIYPPVIIFTNHTRYPLIFLSTFST